MQDNKRLASETEIQTQLSEAKAETEALNQKLQKTEAQIAVLLQCKNDAVEQERKENTEAATRTSSHIKRLESLNEELKLKKESLEKKMEEMKDQSLQQQHIHVLNEQNLTENSKAAERTFSCVDQQELAKKELESEREFQKERLQEAENKAAAQLQCTNELQLQLTKSSEDREKFTSIIEQLESDNKNLQADNDALQSQVTSLQDYLQKTENDLNLVKDAHQELASVKQEITTLKAENERLLEAEQITEDLILKIQELEEGKENDAKQSGITNETEEFLSSDNADLKEKLATMTEKMNDLKSKLSCQHEQSPQSHLTETKPLDICSDKDDTNSNVLVLQEELEKARNDFKLLLKEKEEIEKKLTNLVQEKKLEEGGCQEGDLGIAKNVSSEDNVDRMQDLIDELTKKNDKAEEAVRYLATQIEELEEDRDRLIQEKKVLKETYQGNAYISLQYKFNYMYMHGNLPAFKNIANNDGWCNCLIIILD